MIFTTRGRGASARINYHFLPQAPPLGMANIKCVVAIIMHGAAIILHGMTSIFKGKKTLFPKVFKNLSRCQKKCFSLRVKNYLPFQTVSKILSKGDKIFSSLKTITSMQRKEYKWVIFFIYLLNFENLL